MKLPQTLLEWVVTSAALILVVLALRALLGKRVSACLRYALWAVVLVRLLVPVQLFHLPFAGAVVLPETQIEETSPPVETSASGQSVGSPTIAAPVSDGVAADHSALAAPDAPAVPSAPKAPDMTHTPAWLGWVWLAGAAAVALVLLACNLRFSQKLRRVRLPLEDADCSLPVYVAVGLPSPCLFGVVRPAVYVTPDAAANPILLRHVLVHEATHFHHGDHCWNVLRNIALAVHWWNPLVWLAVILSRRDCELACDEGALKRLDAGERIAYGRTLLALVTEKPRASDLFTCATTMTGDQKGVIERVTRIARAPKRWLWAAVVAVIATALACVCAFGQAEETLHSDDGDLPELTADLTFSLDESDPYRPVVRMDGTVSDLELTRGAFWEPPWQGMMTKKYPYGHLSMVYLPLTDGIERRLTAGWLDAGHTTVILTVEGMVMISSYTPSSWWEFAVDLDQGEVISMETPDFEAAGADGDVRRYPASISEEVVVKAARIAAKLLTAAEDYYNTYTTDTPYLYTALLGGASFYSVDAEKTLTVDTIAEVLDPDGVGYEITRYASVDFDGDGAQELILYVEQQGAFNFILHDMDGELYGYCCGVKPMQIIKTDGTFYNKYAAEFAAESDGLGRGYCKVSFTKTGLEFHPFTYEVNLPSNENGLDDDYRLVVDGQPADNETYQAAVAAQDAKPDVVWYEFSPNYDGNPAPTQPTIPVIDPAPAGLEGVTFSDGWNETVNLEGLEVQEMRWYSPSTYSPYGILLFTNPAFLGPAFEGRPVSGNAQWGDDSHTYIQINWSWDGLPYLDFDIDLDNGAVSREVIWDGLTEEGLLTAARTLAWLMEQAEAYKSSDAYRPVEDGPLPFDRPMELEFASGAGAWQTHLLLHPDGSFVGDYEDADMTIQYVCQFHGRFGDIKQVTDASWSLTLEELVLDTKYPVGTEWDEGIIHYISSNPYGFDGKGGGPLKPGAQFMLYTPDASGYRPTDELYGFNSANTDYDSVMYRFWGWMPSGRKIGAWGWDTKLGCYALCNMETGRGFFDLKAWGIA